jgi:hypothetical protein
MFEMLAGGRSVSDIARWLNGSGILPPKRYLHSKGLASAKESGGHIHWNKGSIYTVLKNRVYCGDMIQGKYRTRSYVQVKLPEKDWVITENTHDEIVSRELFDKVQNLRTGFTARGKPNKQRKRCYKKPATKNVFLRKVICGHCGFTMRRVRTGETQYSFKCETRTFYSANDCRLVSIDENVLVVKLIELIKIQTLAFAKNNHAAVCSEMPDEAIKSEILNARKSIAENDMYLKSLYNSLLAGRITEEEFAELKTTFNKKIANLKQEEKVLRDKKRERLLFKGSREKTAGILKSLRSFKDFTAEAVDKLITKILVFEDKDITVHFKFNEGSADND